MFTPYDVFKYVQRSGFDCPYCKTKDSVESEAPPTTEDHGIDLKVRCVECDRTWVEIYSLASISED